MFQPASISLSGPAFSFLLYETCKSSTRQMGFLIGEVVHKEITSITDNEQKQVDVSKIIKVKSVFPLPSNSYFAKGRVDKEKLRRLLGPDFSRVVAWYKYETSASFKFTLKDRVLHRQFMELFEMPQDLFSVCFLSMECTDNLASYNFQQVFMRYFNGCFDKMSLHIPNLSESNQGYTNSEPTSEVFNKVLSSIKMNLESTTEVVAVTEIANAVQNYMDDVTQELAEAEANLFQLEEDIRLLQSEESEFVSPSIEDEAEEDIHEEQTKPEVRRRTRAESRATDCNKIENSLDNLSPRTRAKGRGRKK